MTAVTYVTSNNQVVTVPDQPAAAATATPVSITAGEVASPTAAQIANIYCTYQLNVAPYTRYRSDGTNIIAEG